MKPIDQLRKQFLESRNLTKAEVEFALTREELPLWEIVMHNGEELREMLTSLRVYDIADEYKEER